MSHAAAEKEPGPSGVRATAGRQSRSGLLPHHSHDQGDQENDHENKKENLGDFSYHITKEQIEKFLKNLPLYEKNMKKHKINPKEALLVLNDLLKSLEMKKQKTSL